MIIRIRNANLLVSSQLLVVSDNFSEAGYAKLAFWQYVPAFVTSVTDGWKGFVSPSDPFGRIRVTY